MNTEEFVKNYLIGFALIGGLFTATSIDPDAAIAGALLSTISNLTNVSLGFLQMLLPVIFDLVTIGTGVIAYYDGGLVGAILVIVVFVSSALVLVNADFIIISILAIIFAPVIIDAIG